MVGFGVVHIVLAANRAAENRAGAAEDTSTPNRRYIPPTIADARTHSIGLPMAWAQRKGLFQRGLAS